jgi:hypothetical protein
MGAGEAADVAGVFDDGALQAEADAEEGDVVFAGVADGGDLAFDAALAEAAGHEDAVDLLQGGGDLAGLDVFGGDLDDLDGPAVGGAAVAQGFVQGFVGVLQFGILADDADLHGAFGMDDGFDHGLPGGELGGGAGHAEMHEDDFVHALFGQHEGHLVDGVAHVEFLDDGVEGHVAEERQFAADFVGEGVSERQTRASGMMPISRSLATLCWLGLVLSRRRRG